MAQAPSPCKNCGRLLESAESDCTFCLYGIEPEYVFPIDENESDWRWLFNLGLLTMPFWLPLIFIGLAELTSPFFKTRTLEKLLYVLWLAGPTFGAIPIFTTRVLHWIIKLILIPLYYCFCILVIALGYWSVSMYMGNH